MYAILTLIILILLFMFMVGNVKPIDSEFEAFKSKVKQSNICMKPFRATCNRDKIYSRIRYLEEKIDEIEYDMYRTRKKHKEYDAYFSKINQSTAQQKADAEAARKEAAAKINSIMAQRSSAITSAVKQERAGDVAKEKAASKQQESQNNKNESDAENNFKVSVSGKSPEAQAVGTMMNSSTKNANKDDQADLKSSIKSANIPSGYVF